MKKKVWGISIGVVVVIVMVIGVILFQKQKKITAAQKEVTTIEQATTKDGELYKEVASLYDEQHDFLAKEVRPATIKATIEKIQNQQQEVEKLKNDFGTKLTTKKAEDTLKKLEQEASQANTKVVIQMKTNELFSSKEVAIDGDNVKDQLPITIDLTQKKITAVTDTVKEEKDLKGKWQESIYSILKNATEQVTEVEKIQKLFGDSFDGNVPKETVQLAEYNTLNKEVEKVKNAELKAGYTAKLILMKAMIDTNDKLNELNRQQQATEQAVNDALAKAQADVDKAAQQAKGDDSLLLGYSDDQIEFARVWLTIIGTKPSELNIRRVASGTALNPYDAGSASYPPGAIVLTGKISADGQIVYTSNRNGTINVYPVPSHWQIGEEVANNPEKVKAMTQEILDNVRVVSVDVCNPRDVVDLIRVEKD